MAIVNYVRESKAFIAYARDNMLTANEFVLWHALFNIFNQQAVANVWPDGFIPVSNSRLLSFTTFGAGKSGENTLIKTRNKLIQRGLIAYKAGEKNKRNPMYRMIYFFVSPVDVTNDLMGNMMGNQMGNMVGNMMGNPVDIVDKPIRDRNTDCNPVDDDDDGFNRAYRQARTQAENEFSRLFGRTATTSELDHIAHVAVTCETTSILHEAMERAAAYGAKNPAMYIATICGDWCDEGITTGKELAEFDLLRESISGDTATGFTPEEARERLQRLRERLHRKKSPGAKEAL